jgi:GR25 family glycosyltransferase involved in LPS biosynthesis
MRFDGLDHIYIVSCGKFPERRGYLEYIFQLINLDIDFYTFSMDKENLNFTKGLETKDIGSWETLTQNTIDLYYTEDPVQRKNELTIVNQKDHANPTISKAAIGLGINHLLIWKDIIKNGYKNVLILEDDTLFFNNSVKRLNSILANLPQYYDIISLEDGAMMHADMYGHKITSDKLLYKIDCGRMRCTGAYLITNKACNFMIRMNEKRKWSLEIDHVIDLYGHLKILSIHWAEPNVFTQGSQRGIYKSSIQGIN